MGETFRVAGNDERAETSQKDDQVSPSLGRPEPHDAAAGPSLFQYVRHILLDHLFHDDCIGVRCAERDLGSRCVVQRGRPIDHCGLLHDFAVHHMQ